MHKLPNLYDYGAPAEGSETVESLLANEGVRIERIISNKASTGWYDQEEDEWVVLLEGSATLQIEEETLSLERGESLLLKARVRHRVLSTSQDALWLAVFIKKCVNKQKEING